MTQLLRPGEPLPYSELMGLTLDGVLVRLTPRCWVPAGAVVDPELRIRALGPPPRRGLVYSHASAHWVWWGAGTGPAVDELTTRTRRRLRTQPPGCSVFERTVGPEDTAELAGLPLTAGLRTLYDEAVRIVAEPPAPPAGGGAGGGVRDADSGTGSAGGGAGGAPARAAWAHALRELLRDVPAGQVEAFAALVGTQRGRPHLGRVRAALSGARGRPPAELSHP